VARSEVLTLLLEGRAEACGGGERAEPAHGVIALFQRTVVLLDQLVLIAAAPVGDFRAARLADGARVGVVPVCRDLRGRASGEIALLAEEPLRRAPVPRRAQPRVDQVPRAVDRAIQRAPAAIDPDRGLVRVPLGAYRATL